MEEFKHMIVDEFKEEDFYETIEAPKFVDLTAPDHRPEGDDRYWFCSRVGCDQKHEEFMDSEVIYKNFVLRVMAARSPNVRLRRALYRKDSCAEPKCPNTVPAKPSRSRVSRLAMISSIPQKANNNGNIKKKEAKVISSTPRTKVKGKDSSVISSVPRKALTERKKQQLQSPAGFRSAQNPRTAAIRASGNKTVAKALLFQSPKKLVKLKRSVELSSSVKKICNGMRKLEIEKNKRNGLEVNDHKVLSSVPARKPLKGREVKSRVFDSLRSHNKTKSPATLKQKVKEKEELVHTSNPSKAHEANGIELANQSLCCESEIEGKERAINAADIDRQDLAVIQVNGLDKAKPYEATEIEDKENALPLECDDDKENVDREDDDDKENSSALDNNRKVTHPSMKKKETCKTSKMVMKTTDKCFNGKTVSASTCVKYTKPKLTNPKPFRLRTDERQILKEANTEKKPEEETTNVVRLNGENLDPKHHPVRMEKNTRGNVSRGTTSTKLVRHDASENKRVALSGKKRVASKRMETMDEEETKEVVMINKSPVCVVASGEKRSVTVPKGPNFHTIHIPKSCIKREASKV